MLDQVFYRKMVVDKTNLKKNRHLKLNGAKNLRDLGGYQTMEGKAVRWGVLYRSDALHRLTDKDLVQLSVLDLDCVIDFRTSHEKELRPDRLTTGMTIRRVEIPILDSSTKAWHESGEEVVKSFTSSDSIKYMCATNYELATQFTPEMAQFLRELSSANGRPVLFHCAAGKDRTGFAAAILLRILGVPQELVMEDYLLTNQYFLVSNRWDLLLMYLLKGRRYASMVKTFMQANPEFLNTAFDAIDRDHGSFENYVKYGLGLSPRDIEHLRNLYLE
jgi:protein-tyrosine phosphatase